MTPLAQTPRTHRSSRTSTRDAFLHEHKPSAAEVNHHPKALPGHLLEQFKSTEVNRYSLRLNVVIISVPNALTQFLRFRAKILPFYL